MTERAAVEEVNHRGLLARSAVGMEIPMKIPMGMGMGIEIPSPRVAVLDSAVGMGSPLVWVWVWGGYGDRNSVPTCGSTGFCRGYGIPIGMGYGYGVGMGIEIPSPRVAVLDSAVGMGSPWYGVRVWG